MRSVKLRKELHQIIDRIKDDKILEAVYTLLEIKESVLYTTNGELLSEDEFKAKIEEGEQDVKEGKVYSHDQVKKYFRKKGK